MKILFVIENLGGGGAERVLVNLVNHMDKAKYDVTVVTLFEKGVNADNLESSVKHINLNKKRFKGMKFLFKFLPKKVLYSAFLKDIVENNSIDLIVAYMTGVPTFVCVGARIPKIAWIHGEFFKNDKLNLLGLRKIYNRFDAVAGVSEYVCNSAKKNIKFKAEPIVVYNVNDTDRIISLAKECNELPKNKKISIITVGCLEKTKGFDRLLNVCKKLKEERFEFNLNILGEGIERKNLEKQIEDCGLSGIVRLLGYQTNPYKFVKNSDLFVCSSRTEGLSTAVSEAVILGVPVVSTDVSGAKEILGKNDEYGIVTENSEDGIYKGLKVMLENSDIRGKYKIKAKERALFFETKNTVGQAEKLFDFTVNKS